AMPMIRTKKFFIAILVLAACSQPEKETPLVPDTNNDGITLPDKFGAIVVVDTLGRGRHLAVNDNGDISVHLRSPNPDGKAIMALRDTDGDGRADIVEGYSDVGRSEERRVGKECRTWGRKL